MNSEENFKKTVNHQQPDHLVVDFGGTAVTGIHVLAVENLRNYYGLEKRPVRVIEPYQMLGEIEADLRLVIGIDVIGAYGKENMFGFNNEGPFKEFKTFWNQTVLVPENFNTKSDPDGNLLMFPTGDIEVAPSAKMPKTGYFFDALMRQNPIVEEQLQVEENLEEFGLVTERELGYWKELVVNLRQQNRAVIASLGGTALGDIALVPGMQMKNPKGIRDITEWYMSTIMRPDYIKAVFEKQIEIAIENYKRYYEVIGDAIDAVFICGTDFGTQDSTFCAPEQFDDLWLPYYKRINDWIHLNTPWKTFKHSCGAVESFMSRFIDSGFDIINPVQVSAKGMDPLLLKKKYGNNLVFWGGGVDTQRTLAYGTPQEVRAEVLHNCEILGRDGGFVFNAVHNIQANVPVKNLVAMIDALHEFNN